MRTKNIVISLISILTPVLGFSQEGLHFEKYTLGEGITAVGNDGGYSMNLTGFIQPYMETRSYEGEGNDTYTRFRLRRSRLRLSGTAFEGKISYRVTGDFSTGGGEEFNSSLLDAFISYNPTSNLSLSVGQRSVATDSREMGISSNALAFVDRSSLGTIFSTIREAGVFIDGTLKVGKNSFLEPSLIITDGDGSFTKGQRYGGLKYGGRLNYLPFGKFREAGKFRGADLYREMFPKLSIGAAFSYNDATSDRRGGRTTGAVLYMDENQNYSLPSYSKLAADFLFKYKGLSVLGEYAKTWASVPSDIYYRVRNDGSLATTFDGGVESYVKQRMLLGEGYNIEGTYTLPSLYLVGFRYTHLKPDTDSYMNNTLYFNRNNFYEITAAKFLTRSNAVKIQASYIFVDAGPDSRDVSGYTMSGNENRFQLIMQISF